MMDNTVVQEDTFKVIRSAVKQLCDLTSPTFGPASKKVVIDKPTHRMVLDDGVQVARDLELDDPAENAIIRIIKEVAIKTSDRVGDGTTGALIMLQAIINEVASRRTFNGRKIELELQKGFEEFSKQITKQAKQIETEEELYKVAIVSFDNPEIAKMISGLYKKLGKEAIITLENSDTLDTYAELADGLQINRGYINAFMVNNQERMEADIKNPYILITDYRIMENEDLMPIMDKLLAAGKINATKGGLVVIADSVEEAALQTMILNQPHVARKDPQSGQVIRGAVPSVAINAPPGDKNTVLNDLAILTGATFFSTSQGNDLKNAEISDLGRADRFISDQEKSIMVEPKGDKVAVKSAIGGLRKNIEKVKSEALKDEYRKRLGMFTNTIATIKVGAPTENEQKALKRKIENAVNSTKTAYIGGVVEGGGKALAKIKTSSQILNKALSYPAKQLFENMGGDNSMEYEEETQAWNLVTGEQGDFMEVGVVDPVDVLVAGVESAVSIANILLTSAGIYVQTPKETK